MPQLGRLATKLKKTKTLTFLISQLKIRVMDRKAKEELGEFFAVSFREVVLPELKDIKENMMTKEDGLSLERKLGKISIASA